MKWCSNSISVAAVSVAFALLAATVEAQSAPLPVSTSVKVLGAATPAPNSSPAMVPMTTQAAVTLPGQKLPQYQTDYEQTQRAADLETGEIVFLLSPRSILDELGRPLIVRATVKIDDAPFVEQRQQRSVSVAAGRPDTPSGLVKQVLDELVEAVTPDGDGQNTGSQNAGTENAGESEKPGDESANPSERYSLAASATEMAARYAAATGDPVKEAEAEWLLGHWTAGPQLLLLNSYFQTFRAEQRPAFIVLDGNEDGVLSTDEIATAVDSLERCDANRDDVVDVLEVAARAAALSAGRDTLPIQAPLLTMPHELVGVSRNNPVLFQPMRTFDLDTNGAIDAAEAEAVRAGRADVAITARFSTRDATTSTLTLDFVAEKTSFDSDESGSNVRSDSSVSVVDQVMEGITFRIGETTINLTAAQVRSAEQVSLGAVVDGYPLLPMLDPNDDGRLTTRERRELVERVLAFDTNGDGAVSMTEAQPPVRICIGLGPVVHRELAGLRSLVWPPTEASAPGPEWFVRMDRNSDNDLSRSEFPGTDEQFQSLDADKDELISAAEASAAETNNDS